MHALSARELLEIWERAAELSPPARALSLLAGACPEISVEDLGRLSVGRRDALLLTLRELTFGPQLASVTACPSCGERLETSFRTEDIRATPEEEPAETLEASVDGWAVRFRLPDSFDLVAIANAVAEPEVGRNLLLERCVLSAERAGESAAATKLPEGVVSAVAEWMERADPQAEVQLALTCPVCGHHWNALFDILSFFWREVVTVAERLLSEVHLLASAYHWREMDILALSPRRRQVYLRMASE
jgi:hypothetical protein